MLLVIVSVPDSDVTLYVTIVVFPVRVISFNLNVPIPDSIPLLIVAFSSSAVIRIEAIVVSSLTPTM